MFIAALFSQQQKMDEESMGFGIYSAFRKMKSYNFAAVEIFVLSEVRMKGTDTEVSFQCGWDKETGKTQENNMPHSNRNRLGLR